MTATAVDPMDHQGLVGEVAKKHLAHARKLGLGFTDLMQAGNVGLMVAHKKFDPTKGVKFATYATWWIMREIKQALDDAYFPVYVPTRVRIGLWRISQGKPGHYPHERPICPGSLKDGERVLTATCPRDDAVLSKLLSRYNPFHLVATEDAHRAATERIKEILATVTKREAAVLRLRFGINYRAPASLEAAGKRLGISGERVRQIEVEAMAKLRKSVKREESACA